jgi:hypothetical protein
MKSVMGCRLFPLIVPLVLRGLLSSDVWGEPMMIVGFGPRVDTTNEIGFRQSEPRAITLLRIGPRVGLSGKSPIGKDQKEDFQQYDVAATFGLPWGWQHQSTGVKLGLRLLTSAGQLAAAQDTALMVTVIPCLAFSSPGEAISVDLGVGPGFLTNAQFGVQNFGGPVQIAATAGIGLSFIPGLYTGYRLQHYSDAGIYGPTSRGADMHLLEVNYRF